MKNQNKLFRPLHIVYLFALLGMIVLIIAASTSKTHDYIDRTAADFEDISGSFHLTPDGDEIIDFSHLGQYISPDSKTLVLYCRLPEMTKDTSLIYRSKDVYTSLFAGDTLLYETSVPNSRFYNKSPGNLWNIVTLDASYSGSLLTLKIDIVYDTKAVTVDHFFFGDSVNIITNFVHNKLFAIIISILMIMLGFYLIILDILPRYRTVRMSHGLLYLGIYASLIGLWSLLETNTLQFFVSDQRILQLINNIVMITDTLPMFIYLNCEYNALKHPVAKCIYIADLAYILVCLVTQFIGKYDLHNLLIGSQIALVVGTIMVFVWIIRSYFLCRKQKMDATPVMLQMLGVGLLFFTAMIEFTKYASADTMDRAASLRLGMFLFIVFFSASSHIQTYRLVEQGLKYNIVNSLAYSDGLTSLGNRTAYLEQLDEYSNSKFSELGIVFLDINDLKKVNDNKGHEMGDELIKQSSVIISESFGKYGKSYRIGGDEFCVLFENENTQSIYETALENFNKLIIQANQNNPFNLEIQIAHGFSICKEPTKQKINDAIRIADHAMYENKAKMKSSAGF